MQCSDEHLVLACYGDKGVERGLVRALDVDDNFDAIRALGNTICNEL